MIISLIVAYALDRRGNKVIGKSNKIPWNSPKDLQRFKEFTTGHPIIMGRKTHESIGRVLPNRENIILSSSKDYKVEGGTVFSCLEDALEYCGNKYSEVFIIGGEKIYKQTIKRADRLYITHIFSPSIEGDSFFPDYNPAAYREIYTEGNELESFHIYQRDRGISSDVVDDMLNPFDISQNDMYNYNNLNVYYDHDI